jgi:hypothetical protein
MPSGKRLSNGLSTPVHARIPRLGGAKILRGGIVRNH